MVIRLENTYTGTFIGIALYMIPFLYVILSGNHIPLKKHYQNGNKQK